MNIRFFSDISPGDVALVGGKGLSLGLMAQAGLPVPPGFCVTTEAYRAAREGEHGRIARGTPLWNELVAAYRQLGGGVVAVRSSATAEDSESASFAGQQVTVLGVEGEQAVCEAVQACWDSLHSSQAVAYRQHLLTQPSPPGRGLGEGEVDVAMAVVVQRLVDAETAGVLFTRDLLDPEARRMLIEASWGLGESVVSGRVTPDRFHVLPDGQVVERSIGHKPSMLTRRGREDVPAERRDVPSLSDSRLAALAELGRRIEEYYGAPRDVEWAWAEGQFYVLQARPITVGGAYEREQVRREEIAALRAKAEPRGTVWARYNLAEVLPAPTPMTWAIVRRFMSGRGGYGMMFRDLGFDPDPSLDEEGFIDLVCGRPYVNLSREPKLYFRRMPLAHSFKDIKANPALAFYPQATPDPEGVTAGLFLRLPVILWRMLRNRSRLKRQPRWYADYLRKEAFPKFAAEVAVARGDDLTKLSAQDLFGRLQRWIDRTLNDFARESLRPAVFAGNAIGQLERTLAKTMPPERTAELVRSYLAGVHPDPEADLPQALHDLHAGTLGRERFLERFGHRGPLEMELAQPRWAEQPDLLAVSPARRSTGDTPVPQSKEDMPRAPAPPAKLAETVHFAITYSLLRETAKHYLMMGYALIRQTLVELDRRFELGGGIFYLEPEELPRLIAGEDFAAVIVAQKRRRELALTIDVPPVLFSDDLEAIGRPPAWDGGDVMQGVPISSGVAEGPALVLEEPVPPAADLPAGYILVCPSTDPAWVPLFLHASGLVMETGGLLSHGAIVAREFHLPAVAGIAGVHRRIATGETIQVDGNRGLLRRQV